MKEESRTVTSQRLTLTAAWRAAGLASMLWLVSAQTAHAEAAVLLPPSGDETLRDAQERAHRALHDALIKQGLRVLTHAEATSEAQTPEARDCKTIDCAPTLLHEVGAALAIGLAVWSSDVDQTVFVTLVDTRGNRFPGRAPVQDGDVGSAATAALLDARALTLLGPGPWLHVHGEPEGAEVVLGGKVIGSTPMRKKVDSGRHVLEVRKPGHKSFVRSVDVPPNAAKQVDVEVVLEPRMQAGEDPALTALDDADGPAGTERSAVWSFVLGGALAAVGAAALAYGIVNLTAVGDCEQRDRAGRCESEVQAGPAITVSMIGGGVALAGAVVMFTVQPIETRGETSGAMLTARGRL